MESMMAGQAEFPPGPLGTAGNELIGAVAAFEDAVGDLRLRLEQAGVLRPDEPRPDVASVPAGDPNGSPLAEMVSMQASKVRVLTLRLRELAERIDR